MENKTEENIKKAVAGAVLGTVGGAITKNAGSPHMARGIAGYTSQIGQAAGATAATAVASGSGVTGSIVAGAGAAKGAVLGVAAVASPVIIPAAIGLAAVVGIYSFFKDN